MPRNRRAAQRRLSVEQESFLLLGNLLTRAFRDETDVAAERRLFGSRTSAAAAWEHHRDALLAADPVPGRRPAGWWRHERRRSVPPVAQQPDLLRALGCLSASEQEHLEEWRRTTPEPPADLSLDHSVIDPITTEDTDVEAQPAAHPEARTRPPEIPRGHGDADRADAPEPGLDGAEASAIPASEHERADAPDPQGRRVRGARENDVILPWPRQKGRHPNEGWL